MSYRCMSDAHRERLRAAWTPARRDAQSERLKLRRERFLDWRTPTFDIGQCSCGAMVVRGIVEAAVVPFVLCSTCRADRIEALRCEGRREAA